MGDKFMDQSGPQPVSWRHWLRADWSTISLLGSNLFVIVLAVVEGWALREVIWIYWGQSVIIGLSNFARILRLRRFSTEGVRVNDRPVDPTPQTRRQAAFFFLFHYGFFHAGYLVFLAAQTELPREQLPLVLTCLAAFAANHAFSLVYNWRRDAEGCPNLGMIMLLPYGRILPMHLTIVLGVFLAKGVGGTVFFLLLKAGADLLMHGVEHAGLSGEPGAEAADAR